MRRTTFIAGSCIVAALLGSCRSNTPTLASKIISLERQSALSSRQTHSIDSLIALLPKGSEVGISIYNLTKEKPMYSYREAQLAQPASTMKLLTTISTLSYPEGRKPFTTNVWYKGYIKSDTLKGDIYVQGTMDPEFDERAMDSLVSQIKNYPFKVIKGNIVGDLSMKDSLYWGSGWMWDDAPYDYQPQLTPLIYHKGIITVTAYPDSVHHKGILISEPESKFYNLYNHTEYNNPDLGYFRLSRDYLKNSNTIFVEGNIGNKKTSASITVSDVPAFFLSSFKDKLQEKGEKTVMGQYTTVHDSVDYSSAHLIASWSTDSKAVVKQLLKQSDNLNAEAMFYRLAYINGARPATADKAVEVMYSLIETMGLDVKKNNYNIADGSGLSRYDCLTPQLEVAFLRYAAQRPDIYDILYPSLPIAGVDGSLHRRMKDAPVMNNVHAKTGSYSGVNALAGYLTDKMGDKMAFSIMNLNILSEKDANNFQDNICRILCK